MKAADKIKATIARCSIGGARPESVMVERVDLEELISDLQKALAERPAIEADAREVGYKRFEAALSAAQIDVNSLRSELASANAAAIRAIQARADAELACNHLREAVRTLCFEGWIDTERAKVKMTAQAFAALEAAIGV